ncbi:MAG TPA: hypothetical protein VM328_02410 [Fimbriimonadaceae bacterium]|nr:hypothetical protein [Fimbriimonadaceae bacterium]
MNIFLAHGLSAALSAASLVTPQGSAATGAQVGNLSNIQLSLVTDFRAALVDQNPDSEKRAFLKEAELGLAADVDPFLRAEAYIAFVDEDGETAVEVEEAFGRYSNFGKGLSLKFGKIAAAVGRVQRNHVDQLNWLDFPFVIEDFFGEEGLRGGGLSVSYLFPGDRFHELTFEAIDAPDEGIFAGAHTGAPAWVGHYRTFFDFSQNDTAQLGLTYVNGPGGSGRDRSSAYGIDLTYKRQPAGLGRATIFEGEAYWTRPSDADGTHFGAFAAVTQELMPRLFFTAKLDYSEIPGGDEIRRAMSLGATLKVTEFHHWRAEFQRVSSNFDRDRNVLTLQFQWLIGAHPAHRY